MNMTGFEWGRWTTWWWSLSIFHEHQGHNLTHLHFILASNTFSWMLPPNGHLDSTWRKKTCGWIHWEILGLQYLNPKDIFWCNPSLIDFQRLQACPGNHHSIVGAQPRRGGDCLPVEVFDKADQSLPHRKIACHTPGYHKVGGQLAFRVQIFTTSLDSFCQMF